MALTRPRLLRFALHMKICTFGKELEAGSSWTVLNSQRTSWVQTKTAHHDPCVRRFSATQVALTRPRLLRFALHFTILSLNIRFPNLRPFIKGVEEDREDPVLKIGTQPGQCSWSFSISPAPSYGAISMLNWSTACCTAQKRHSTLNPRGFAQRASLPSVRLCTKQKS